MIYILDASGMVAWIRREPGAEIVEQILLNRANTCLAHGVNICEVYYGFLRSVGATAARAALEDLLTAGVGIREDLDALFCQEVGNIRAIYGVPFADSFCVALAQRLGGEVVTGDHKDFDPIVPLRLCAIRFIR